MRISVNYYWKNIMNIQFVYHNKNDIIVNILRYNLINYQIKYSKQTIKLKMLND